MRITKTELPEQSVLKINQAHFDYVDSFEGEFTDALNTIDSTQVAKSFFKSGPKWIDNLFALRNKIVKFFGLKTSGTVTDKQKQLDNFKCEVGEQLGLFKVFNKTTNEVIIGEDDKHLNFRVSLYIHNNTNTSIKKRLTITTTVQFNNWFGRLYFMPVRPFHKHIVPSILKGIIKDLEKIKKKLHQY